MSHRAKTRLHEFERVRAIASALSDATRLQILLLLLDRPDTPGNLATLLGRNQPRVSAHLRILKDAGLVKIARAGRHCTYATDRHKTARIIAALAFDRAGGAIRPASRAALREVNSNTPLRQARTCYDHLAGVAGVELLQRMRESAWIVQSRVGGKRVAFALTKRGQSSLQERNVDTRNLSGHRTFAYGCLDWTERRYHLGGALGAAILDTLFEDGTVRKLSGGSRTVTLCLPLARWIDG